LSPHFEAAQRELMPAEEVTGTISSSAISKMILDNPWYLISEAYCQIHQKINIMERLRNLSQAEGEKWIVNLIREMRMGADAKIDLEKVRYQPPALAFVPNRHFHLLSTVFCICLRLTTFVYVCLSLTNTLLQVFRGAQLNVRVTSLPNRLFHQLKTVNVLQRARLLRKKASMKPVMQFLRGRLPRTARLR